MGMATPVRESGGSSPMMMKGWHWVGISVGLAVLLTLFFAAGYGFGLTQDATPLRAEASTLPRHAGNSIDGLATVTSLPASTQFVVAGSAKPRSTTRYASGKTSELLSSSPISRGMVLLQVSAEHSKSGALELVRDLNQNGFPAFVVPANGDGFFRVQIGPYADAPSADLARKQLEEHGYRPIIKR